MSGFDCRHLQTALESYERGAVEKRSNWDRTTIVLVDKMLFFSFQLGQLQELIAYLENVRVSVTFRYNGGVSSFDIRLTSSRVVTLAQRDQLFRGHHGATWTDICACSRALAKYADYTPAGGDARLYELYRADAIKPWYDACWREDYATQAAHLQRWSERYRARRA